MKDLPLVSREWKNGSNSSSNCTPFLNSLLTKAKKTDLGFEGVGGSELEGWWGFGLYSKSGMLTS